MEVKASIWPTRRQSKYHFGPTDDRLTFEEAEFQIISNPMKSYYEFMAKMEELTTKSSVLANQSVDCNEMTLVKLQKTW
ncbi:hypothetical protein MJO28_011292 [Puccinia striiformis f. sp. tritici]|uniref:Uncharacterized protein n=1 Tax=Puccinia striiformis f. sp. tritici TaxID=168172 RepID=A0ACC0E3B0_9BASI|nr:hypothetical protein MJO28_011292 [Puccinia striiformis f. sp. tritici]KAI7946547.1 hypothetical protein MJO29_011074 [Puccinia striiformis f. sp. tritici]